MEPQKKKINWFRLIAEVISVIASFLIGTASDPLI